MVAPGVLQAETLLLWADGVLPAVSVPEAVAAAVNHASAGEAHELRLEVGQSLSEILAQAVALEGVGRHEREHVHVDVAGVEHEHLQHGICGILGGCQRGLIFLPLRGIGVERGLGQQLRVLAPALWHGENHAHLLGSTDVADEGREVVLRPGLDADAVEAAVLQAVATEAVEVVELTCAFHVQTHVCRVVGMDAVGHAHLCHAE